MSIKVLSRSFGRTVAIPLLEPILAYEWREYYCTCLGCSFEMLVRRHFTIYEGLPLPFTVTEFLSDYLTLPSEPLAECLVWRDVERTIQGWVAKYTRQSIELIRVIS